MIASVRGDAPVPNICIKPFFAQSAGELQGHVEALLNPGSCSLASHAALEEAGLPYEAELIDLTQNAQFSDAYRQKNPWARVPALQIGDDVLTENIAILNHISE